jgi:hypothetical protein
MPHVLWPSSVVTCTEAAHSSAPHNGKLRHQQLQAGQWAMSTEMPTSRCDQLSPTSVCSITAAAAQKMPNGTAAPHVPAPCTPCHRASTALPSRPHSQPLPYTPTNCHPQQREPAPRVPPEVCLPHAVPLGCSLLLLLVTQPLAQLLQPRGERDSHLQRLTSSTLLPAASLARALLLLLIFLAAAAAAKGTITAELLLIAAAAACCAVGRCSPALAASTLHGAVTQQQCAVPAGAAAATKKWSSRGRSGRSGAAAAH